MKQLALPALALSFVMSLTACNGAPPSTTVNSMTSAGAIEPAADNIAAAPAKRPQPAPSPSASGTGAPARDYAGRWVGVEGTFLNVTLTGPNTASLDMQYDLDNRGTYPATITPEGLRFDRNGETLLLRPSDGDATGLKWLAGEKNCLTVKAGEGYCRA